MTQTATVEPGVGTEDRVETRRVRVKRYLRERHRRFVFRRTLRACRRLPPGIPPRADQLEALTYAWNNDGWSASTELIQEALRCAWQARGPILECGTGLSTLLLGLAAERTGNAIWSLEHDDFWIERVRRSLAAHRIGSVHAVHAPLASFGDYWWYDVDPARLPNGFSLVVCDGPPGSTPGGRYGMLPVMRARLASGCVILLDDASRPEEQHIIARWERELGCRATLIGAEKPFARLTAD